MREDEDCHNNYCNNTQGHDQCDARSDRRRPCIRERASKVGGGVAVMKCGLARRP